MYPCNMNKPNKPIDFKTKSADFCVCAPTSAAFFPGCLCSVHLKVLKIPGHEKGGRP